MKKVVLILLVGLISFTSLAEGRKKRQKRMDSWLDVTQQQLYLQYGPPDRVTSDGAGGEIAIYADRVYVPSMNYGAGVYSQPVDYYKYEMYFVNKDHIIYSWRFQTSPNPPQRFDVNVRADVYQH